MSDEEVVEDEDDQEDEGPPTWFRAADLAPYGALSYLALGSGIVGGAMVFERGREGVSAVWWPVALVAGFVVSVASYVIRRRYWLERAEEIDAGERVAWADLRRVVTSACARRLVVGVLLGLVVAPIGVLLAWACVGLAAGTAVEGALVRRWERRHDRGLYRSVARKGVALGPPDAGSVAPH
jgi:hypothetical protein